MEKTADIPQPSSTSKKNLIILALGVLLFGGGVYAGVNQYINTQPQTQQTGTSSKPTNSPENISPYTLIYGVWAKNGSLIKAFDLVTKDNYNLADLPQNIKRVTAVMPDTIYYINNTNENDHGTEVVKYSISGGQPAPVANAEAGFGIDDYYISPDGRYLTTWEVSLAQGSTQLTGGKSRVYSIDLTAPAAKNLLYDEDADKPVHYPRGITNNGTVITDMFLPNTGPGWAYGMGSSDFTGLNKKDITVMANGTYGRQPRMSYDGSQLVFVGYDGVNGSGTEQITGLRRSVIHPNTIELLSPDTLQRTKLPGLSERFVFDDVRFDPGNKYLFASQVKYANPGFVTDVRLFDLEDNSTIGIPNSENKRGFAMLSDSQALVGSPVQTGQTMGNLGETYQFINSKYEILNIKDGHSELVSIPYSNTQYIGIFPTSSTAFSNLEEKMATDTLQLHTFVLKPKLLSNRINLQAGSNLSSKRSNLQSAPNTDVKGVSIIAQVPGLSGTPSSSPALMTPIATIAPSANPNTTSAPAAEDVANAIQDLNVTIPANIESVMDKLKNGELTVEMIQELIDWIQNLLGIQEQQAQN